MAVSCPNCAVPISRWRGVRGRALRAAGTRRFQFAPKHFYCRACNAELRPRTRPAGYAIYALLLVTMIGWQFAAMRAQKELLLFLSILAMAPLIGVFFAVCMNKWGFYYSVAKAD